MTSIVKNRGALLGALAALLVAAIVGGYWMLRSSSRLPSPDSPTYEEVVRSFHLGLANLEVGLLDDARRGFLRAGELVPGEPAIWANLGLVEIRLGELEKALPMVQRAASLAPESGEVELLFGQLETSRGRLDEGVGHFRRAVELDPGNLRARAALAQEIERAAGQNADGEAQRLFEELLALRPDNLAVLLERARLAAKRADLTLLQDTVGRLGTYRSSWPALAAEQYGVLERAAGAGSFSDAARAVVVLRNVLVRLPAFREGLVEIRTPAELIAEPFTRFLKLPPPSARPSPPDEGLTFSRESLGAVEARPTAMAAFALNATDAPVVFAAAGRGVHRIDAPGSDLLLQANGSAPSWNGLLALDWSRDFKTDLALVGNTGLRLLVQGGSGEFTDVTPEAARNGAAVTADAIGVWTADIEMDGDLDLVVGVKDGPPVVLRNNGDGTWRQVQPFAELAGVRGFVWGDLDRDGDPDAAFADERGDLRVFANRQGGDFQPIPTPEDVRNVVALALGDLNADGMLDLITMDRNGSVRRMSAARREGAPARGAGSNSPAWDQQQLVTSAPRNGAAQAIHRLLLADLDNSGTVDLVASGAGRSQVWLVGERGELQTLAGVPEGEIFGAVDLNRDGQLDLLGLVEGQPVRLLGRGTKGYHWQVFRTRAQQTAGDQRINSFGVGGDIEIRSGLLTQKQLLTGSPAHFGLGTHTTVDVARIVWPNGVVQAEFGRRADEVVVAEQRLKGSCPWVFTFDGTGMRFVTDFLWRSPLGLRINAQDTAGVTQTEDWVRIRGDQLVAKNGEYDVRITAELWESHFVDHLSLMVVDHPNDTEVFVDERFSKDAPILAVHATSPPASVVLARDDAGRDVTALVARQDGRYLATFERGTYQGIAQDHFVEIELGDRLAADKPQWLIANGWIYPTDSSINVAIGQGSTVRPQGLSLEAQADGGRWLVIDPDLGFPAGKNKTILIDLGRVTRGGVRSAQRLRLRTNLEVYWDWIAVADGLQSSPSKIVRLQPGRADLRFRGFSETTATRRGEPGLASNRDGPEVPIYDKLGNVTPRWRDLVGYYTRFGDVRELLQQVDDRYVIMNAGDELQLTFPALPQPAAGWKRDFVLVADGWEKDGDFNTGFSATVLPLPSHDRPDYGADSPALELEGDAVYRRYPLDWQTYHTRYVTPDLFLDGLRQRR